MKRLYVGLDVHAASTTVVVMTAEGKRVVSQVIPTTATALIAMMRQVAQQLDGELHICVEEGTQSTWVHETLRPHAAEVLVTMPVRKSGPKSDLRDATALADKLRRGTLETIVYKGAGPFTSLRECVRAHRMITSDLLRAKCRIKAIFRGRGLHVEGDDLYVPKTRSQWIAKLEPKHRGLAEMLGTQIDMLVELHRGAAERLKEEASHHPVVDRLMTVPCIGILRAAYIVATVVTPDRFRTKRQFWTYCGLAVVTRSSADWVLQHRRWVRTERSQTRGLNTNRNPVLKEVFKGAALHVTLLRDGHPLKVDYEQLVARGLKPPVARVTMARRLAATVLAVWKHEEVYDSSRRYQPPRPE